MGFRRALQSPLQPIVELIDPLVQTVVAGTLPMLPCDYLIDVRVTNGPAGVSPVAADR